MYKLYFRKEKIIYSNLNKCILRDNFIDGEIWIPKNKLDLVTETIKNVFKENENKLTANLFDLNNPNIDLYKTLLLIYLQTILMGFSRNSRYL
jgi:hypothetical protein